MAKKDTFIVRSGRSGSSFALPGGVRVRTLDRATFDRAVGAANSYISTLGSCQHVQGQPLDRRSGQQVQGLVTRRERT
jgi:hypothetical protein